MRVMTVLGTRPEIITLSRIIPALDKSCDHTLVHTGQNVKGLILIIHLSSFSLLQYIVYMIW